MKRNMPWLAAVAALVPGALWSAGASAALGGPVSALASEPQLHNASVKRADFGSYRVHEIQTVSGTMLREYSGLDGKVFAVTWTGQFIPDLRETLGSYFDEYAAAAGTPHGNHKHLEVRTPNLVVVEGGHMRAHHGIAYLPQALPSGVTPADLR